MLHIVKISAYMVGYQVNYFINDYLDCIPLFGKEGLGEIFKGIIPKIPLTPPFPKEET